MVVLILVMDRMSFRLDLEQVLGVYGGIYSALIFNRGGYIAFQYGRGCTIPPPYFTIRVVYRYIEIGIITVEV